MQQRYYDPYAGRFLAVDPVAASPGSFNRYWYANNNPYKYTDSDGRVPVAIVGCAASTACAGAVLAGAGAAIAGLKASGGSTPVLPAAVLGPSIISGVMDQIQENSTDEPGYSDVEDNQPPFVGAPGSTVRGGTGSRTYGDDGYPVRDRDAPHPDEKGCGSGDHCHDWGRPNDGGPPTNRDRGPPRPPQPGDPPAPRGPNVPPPDTKSKQ